MYRSAHRFGRGRKVAKQSNHFVLQRLNYDGQISNHQELVTDCTVIGQSGRSSDTCSIALLGTHYGQLVLILLLSLLSLLLLLSLPLRCVRL
jgi:hypothetical protein